MPKYEGAWEEHQRKRWMRPDAARWLKPPRYEPEVKSIQPPAWTAECDAELEAIRRQHLHLKWMAADLRLHLLRSEFARKYRPDQPRVPAGSSDGGQWTSAGGDVGSGPSDISAVSKRAARLAICAAQYTSDLFHCKMVGKPQCYAQAMERLVACEKGRPIPPLNY